MDLVNSLRSGDHRSLTKLYKMYSPALLGIISRIVKNDEVALDMLQECFTKIWKSVEQYEETKGRFFTWMARLARNQAIDYLRGRSYINSCKNLDIDDVYTEVDSCNNTSYNPETIGLRHLTNQLKESQRRILNLIYFEGYTQTEVAEELNIPLGTVKTRLRMAIHT
ncbi:MAG: sigma-70 family RNA polymerase sigma factor, partial [Pedobacter sp.]